MVKQIIYCLLFLSILASPLLSFPTQHMTKLPVPEEASASDLQILKEILKLELRTDSQDKKLLYYAPPFHIREFEEGAGSLLMNIESIEGVAKAKNQVQEREAYAKEYFIQLQKDEEQKKEDLSETRRELAKALATGNERIIAIWEDAVEMDTRRYNKSFKDLEAANQAISAGRTILPLGLASPFDNLAMFELARAGIRIDYPGKVKPENLHKTIDETIIKASSGHGGFLSFNAYAGFSEEQLEALQLYRNKFHSDYRIVLLPAEKLSFFPLSKEQSMFKEVNGSGDYLGSTVVADTTVRGSSAMAAHPGALIVPVGINVTYNRQVLPVEAELDCDFSSGFYAEGRADVKDGWQVYDNDIYNNIKTGSIANGACNFKHISGDKDSAEVEVLKNLEKVYEKMRLQRIELSTMEKERYWAGVLEDIDNNRRKGGDGYSFQEWRRKFNGWNHEWVLVKALSESPGYHWYTNIQDVENFSSIKFNKRISIGDAVSEKANLPLAPNLCLVYDTSKQSFARCTEVEKSEANRLEDAAQAAMESSACEGEMNPITCGKKRDEAASVARKGTHGKQTEKVVNEI